MNGANGGVSVNSISEHTSARNNEQVASLGGAHHHVGCVKAPLSDGGVTGVTLFLRSIVSVQAFKHCLQTTPSVDYAPTFVALPARLSVSDLVRSATRFLYIASLFNLFVSTDPYTPPRHNA